MELKLFYSFSHSGSVFLLHSDGRPLPTTPPVIVRLLGEDRSFDHWILGDDGRWVSFLFWAKYEGLYP